MKNKEYGSDFDYPIKNKFLLDNKQNSIFSSEEFSLFFSGRAVLYHILKNGIENNNWKKVYVPSFYCHEVVHFIKPLQIEIQYYEFNPFLDSEEKQPSIDDLNTNVIVNVLFFGLKKINLNNFKNIIQIDDVTHSILEFKNSKADYCFGSLRKELPVPVGGFCNSPKNKQLPKAKNNNECEQVVLEKIAAMFLKNQYLKGNFNKKDSFRKLYIEAETSFESDYTNALIPEIAKTILLQLNIKKIIESKGKNIKKALSLLLNNDLFTVNLNSINENVFGLILECKTSNLQKELKQYLINNKIFPAVLWPNQIMERDREIEKRILFIHLDFRYSKKDTNKIIDIINAFK